MVGSSPLFEHIPFHLVHVSKDPASAQDLVLAAKIQLEQANRQVFSDILQGDPAEALCQYQASHGIDLTVMGAFSHNRLRELVFGSFTMKMLLSQFCRSLTCPPSTAKPTPSLFLDLNAQGAPRNWPPELFQKNRLLGDNFLS